MHGLLNRPLPHGTFLLGKCGPSPSLDPKVFIDAIPNGDINPVEDPANAKAASALNRLGKH
jgi:hypothetical protein